MDSLNQPLFGGPIRYGFSGSILAILENQLLNQNKIEQLKVAENLKEFMRQLSDTVYGHYFDKNIGINDLVEAETLKTKETLYEILPEDIHWFFDKYYRRYDYNNLKMLIKSYFMEREFPLEDLALEGDIPPVNLLHYFEEENFEELPFEINLEELRQSYKKTGELRIIDAALDRQYYREYLDAVEKLGDPFILDYLRKEIDLKNIVIFIRSFKAGLPMEDYLLDGGKIPVEEFLKHKGEGTDVLICDVEFHDYKAVIQDGLSVLDKTGSFTQLETSVRNHLIEMLTETKDIIFTVKPFFGYLIAKEHEIQLIRKLYIHISNHIEFGAERDLVYV
jgi:V/A-type H+-transporting ATPase subunit C